MEKISNYLSEKLEPKFISFQSNRYLVAMKNGIYGALGAITIGSFFLLFSNLPIPGYENFMLSLFGEQWMDFFLIPFTLSLNILTLYVFFGVVQSLSEYYKLNGIPPLVTSLISFLLLNPIISDESGALGISMTHLGPSSLFLGVLTAILAVEIYRIVIQKKILIKFPDSVPSAVSNSFSSLIPGTIVILFFNFLRLFFSQTSYGTAHNFINTILQKPIMAASSSIWGILILIFTENFLWAFGIHGSSVISTSISPIIVNLTAENAIANAINAPRPNIVNQQFLGIFVNLGGSGATLGLVILCLFFSNSKRLKSLGKVSIAPSIFMVNEPIIFGLPVVLNPVMMVPMIFVPLTMALVTYFVMYTGIVPITNGVILPWTTPPIIGGFILAGIRGAIYQVFQLILSTVLYYPFFKIEDKKAVRSELLAESL